MNVTFVNKRLALLLGCAALLPFAFLSLACWLVHPDWMGAVIRAQISYGIAILSFLGGAHWGAALVSPQLSQEQIKKALIWAVLPAALSWFAVLAGMGLGFVVLVAGFIGAYQVDKHLYRWYEMPEWFLQLRYRLTWAVGVALALTFIAANVRG